MTKNDTTRKRIHSADKLKQHNAPDWPESWWGIAHCRVAIPFPLSNARVGMIQSLTDSSRAGRSVTRPNSQSRSNERRVPGLVYFGTGRILCTLEEGAVVTDKL